MVTNKCIDINKLIKEGGDIYQKLAEQAGISREQAKLTLFPYLYGKPLQKIEEEIEILRRGGRVD